MRTWVTLSPPKDFDPRLIKLFKQINLNGQQTSTAIYRIGTGVSPDNAGIPLFDGDPYFKLAGRTGGQLGYGDVASGGALTLSSTSNTTKGKVYLGSAQTQAAFDELNGLVGVGVVAPTATLHVRKSSTTTIYRATSVTNNTGSRAKGAAGADITAAELNDASDATYVQMTGADLSCAISCVLGAVPTTAGATYTFYYRIRNPGAGPGTAIVGLTLQNNSGAANVAAMTLVPGINNPQPIGQGWSTFSRTVTAAELTANPLSAGTGIIYLTISMTRTATNSSPQTADVWLVVSGSSANQVHIDGADQSTVATIVDIDGSVGVRTGNIPLLGALHVAPGYTGGVGIVAKALTGQTANVLEAQTAASSTAVSGFNAAGRFFLTTGAGASNFAIDGNGTGQLTWDTPKTFTLVNDTNVTASVTAGSLTGALIKAATVTFGWNGTLSKLRGGKAVADASVASNLTTQTGSIAAQTLLTGAAGTAGMYRVSVYVKTTTAGLGGDTVIVTLAWNDGTPQTLVVPFTDSTPIVYNLHDLGTATAYSQGSVVINVAASQNISYTTTVSIVGTPQYEIHVRTELVG